MNFGGGRGQGIIGHIKQKAWPWGGRERRFVGEQSAEFSFFELLLSCYHNNQFSDMKGRKLQARKYKAVFGELPPLEIHLPGNRSQSLAQIHTSALLLEQRPRACPDTREDLFSAVRDSFSQIREDFYCLPACLASLQEQFQQIGDLRQEGCEVQTQIEEKMLSGSRDC